METRQYITSKDASRALKEAGFDAEAFVYHTVGSTNEVARALLAAGKREGTLVLARAQSRGRGRMDRSWHSTEGGLYISIVLGPFGPVFPATLIPIMAGVALAKALADSHGLSPSLKWPNDVLLSNKKVSGILSEAATFPERGDGAVLGIGVNCLQDSFPAEIAGSATSILLETGSRPSLPYLLERLLVYLSAGAELLYLENREVLLEEWRRLSCTLGRMVRVELAARETIWGLAKEIDGNGRLIVDVQGKMVPVVAGDLVHLRTDWGG